MSFFNELKRRNVFRVGIAYVIGTWLLIQVADIMLEAFELPESFMRLVISLLVIGLPVVLFAAWAFELTPDGVKRESEIDRSQSIAPMTGKKLNAAIMAMLVIVLGYFVWESRFSGHDAIETVEHKAVNTNAVQTAEQQVDPETNPKSIAVLPFVNMSSDLDQEYFSDGISEELLNLLTKIPQLRVIARTSSFSFKGKDVPIKEIAETLNVAYVLEGSVRKSGNKVRITAQLIRASDSTHLWSEAYDRTLEDVFAIQDEIAATVVAQLKIKLLGELPRVQKVDPEAYSLLLQARHLKYMGTADARLQSNALLQEALIIDPTYAAAWESLAFNYADEGSFNQALIAARRALELNPNSPRAEKALGITALRVDLDLAIVAHHYQRAVMLDPTDPRNLMSAGWMLSLLGRFEEAITILEIAISLDPVIAVGHQHLAIAYGRAGRLDEAIASWHTVHKLSPQWGSLKVAIGLNLAEKEEFKEALVWIKQEPSESYRLFGLALVNQQLGNLAESVVARDELIAKYAQTDPVLIALLFDRVDLDLAFEWLDKAVQYRDPKLMILAADQKHKESPLKNDPRWLLFLERIGTSPTQLDAIEFKVELPD